MRAALLFCGRITGYEHCYETFIKHFVEPLRIEYDSFLAHNAENSSTDIERFVNLYNVKHFANEYPIIENFNQLQVNTCGGACANGVKMFYFWKRSFELMKNYSQTHNIQYGVVIYMRADAIFQESIKLPPIEKNCVYIPEGCDFLNGLNDQMAIGQTATMEMFMDVYSNIIRIYSKTNIPFHPETYVRLLTQMSNMGVIRFKLDYQLHPTRHIENTHQ
jgi:hypothetical protein